MTFDDFVQIGRIQSKMESYRRKKENAIAICCDLFGKCKNPYLALSGGKDSVAMAFIVNEAAVQCGKNFRIWSHVSDASFPGTVETCQEVAARLSRPLDLWESECSAFDAVKQEKRQSFGKSGVFFDSVREYAKDKDVAFVGVRARESKRRSRAAKAHGQVFESRDMGDVTVCHPLLWFRLEDVAAALYEYNAPVHPIYKKTPIDSGRNALREEQFIRLSYVTSKDLLNKGTAVFLKVNYPALFNRLAEVYPDIRLWV